MKKNTKLISILLTFCIGISSVPCTALAAGVEQLEEFSNVTESVGVVPEIQVEEGTKKEVETEAEASIEAEEGITDEKNGVNISSEEVIEQRATDPEAPSAQPIFENYSENIKSIPLEQKTADFVFIIDSTGSMESYINSVRTNLTEFVEYLSSQNIDLRMAVVDYKDISYDGADSTSVHSFGDSIWTSDVEAVKSEFSTINVRGGGDSPETPTEALSKITAEGWGWRSDAAKFAFLLTDADFKESSYNILIPNMEDVIGELQNQSIQATVVGKTSYAGRYKGLHDLTGGKFIDITSRDYYELMIEIANWVIESVTDGVIVGELEEMDLNNFTITIDGQAYDVSDDFDMTDAAQILNDYEYKIVRGVIEHGKLVELEAIIDIVELSLKIKSDSADIRYEDEKFSSNQMKLTAELKCTTKAGYSISKADMDKLGFMKYNVDSIKVSVLGDGKINFGTSGIIFQNKKRVEICEINSSMALGEKSTYTFDAYIDDGYVPDNVNTTVNIVGGVKWRDDSDYRLNGSCDISINNVDLQRQKAAEKKANTTTQKLVKEAQESLASNTELGLDSNLAAYFDNAQRKKIKDFLTVWITEIVGAESVSYYKEDQKLVKAVMGKLGVNVNSIAILRPVKATVEIVGETVYGKKTFEFSVNMDNYILGQGNPFAAYGKIEYEVRDKSGIPGNVAKTGKGMITFANMKNFAKQVQDVAEAAVKSAYNSVWGNNANAVAGIIVNQTILKIIDSRYGSFSNGVYELFTTPVKNSVKHVTAKCPVDVYVYDSDNKLCGAIVNNIVDPAYNEVYMYIEDNAKQVQLIGDGYRIELIGNDTGTMDYEVEEYIDGELTRKVETKNIPLSDGKTYTAFIPEEVGIDNALYMLNSDTGEVLPVDSDTLENGSDTRVYADGVILDKTNIILDVGDSTSLTATVSPDNATNKDIIWESSNKQVAAVDSNGKVIAYKAGTATISVKTKDGGFSATCMVTVNGNTHSWSSWKVIKQATVLTKGEQQRTCSICKKIEKKAIAKLPATIKLNMKTIPLKVKQSTKAFKVSGLAKGDKVKSYKSSNAKIASVNSAGKITGKKKGTAKITVTLISGKKATAIVKVQKGTVASKKIILNKSKIALTKGHSFAIKPKVFPLTSQQKVVYKSSNKNIATVSSSGTVIAKKKGTAIITVKSGIKYAKLRVVVNSKFVIVENNMTWNEAKQYCEDKGGHLATITSKIEQDEIQDLIVNGKFKGYWLGAYITNNKWHWISGEAFKYQNWDVGEPNGESNDMYLQIFNNNGLWDDTWNEGDNGGGIKMHGCILEYE